MNNNAIELDEELLQQFYPEVADIMESLGDDFMAFEEQIDNPQQDLIAQIFRGLHTIKGNAGFVGLTGMSKLSHSMEDIFAAVRNDTFTIQPTHMDHLFAGLDTLKDMLADPRQSNNINISENITTYQAILDGSFQGQTRAEDSEAPHPVLQQFLKSDDLMERIELLQEMENKQLSECIPGLWTFIDTPFADDPLNVILDSTIKVLLGLKPDYIIAGLSQPGINVQTLSVQLAGKYQLTTALRSIFKILDQTGVPTPGAIAPEDNELIRASLKTLGELHDPLALPYLKKYAFNDDPVLAATAVTAIGQLQPDFRTLHQSFEHLQELAALAMLDGMAGVESDINITFLVDHIHHPKSVIRRIIASHIISIAQPALPPLAQKLIKGDREEKIMAANILAGMKSQKVLPYLVTATRDQDENIRFAAHEALVNISSYQSCYTCHDGLFDPALSIRVLVLHHLEENVSAIVTGKIRRALQKDDGDSQKIREAMAHVAVPHILAEMSHYSDIFPPIFTEIKQHSSSTIKEQYTLFLEQDNCRELRQIWDSISEGTDSRQEPPQTVLLVDDSLITLKITANTLNKAGYATVTAMDGQQGLTILANQPIDLVITDMNMPVMTGIEMIREIRNNILLNELPCIMVTSEEKDNERQAAIEAGIDIFHSKPCKAKQILASVESLLK